MKKMLTKKIVRKAAPRAKKMSRTQVFAAMRINGVEVQVLESDLEDPYGTAPSFKASASSRKKHFAKFAREGDGEYGNFRTFKMWKTERFGWCFPTLLIRNATKSNQTHDRTYAISERGELCRIGLGPHITLSVDVYIKKDRLAKLQPILDLIKEGEIKAHEKRDDISTARARSTFSRKWWM